MITHGAENIVNSNDEYVYFFELPTFFLMKLT